jgi:two-component system response regulator DesR
LPTLRILLAEDVAMVRGALVALIELEADFKVVASIRNGSDIVPTALACQPDVSIIDIDLPGLDGLSAAAQLHQALPACRTLILTNLSRAGTDIPHRNARVPVAARSQVPSPPAA